MRPRLLALLLAGSVAMAAVVIAMSSGHAPTPTSTTTPPATSAPGAPEPDAPPLAYALDDLDAPRDLVTGIADGTLHGDAPESAADLVWIARAHGTARVAILGAVAALLRERVDALPDHLALEAILDDLGGEASGSPVIFPQSDAIDHDTVVAVGLLVTAAREPGTTLDETWLGALAAAAGEGPAAPLAAALATRTEPRERTLGFQSVMRLDRGRLDGVPDRDIDIMLLAHDIVTNSRSPHEGLAPIIESSVAEAEILNGGFAQLAANEPEISLPRVAEGYRAIGLPDVAEIVDRVAAHGPTAEDDTAYMLAVDASDVHAARARYVRELVEPRAEPRQ